MKILLTLVSYFFYVNNILFPFQESYYSIALKSIICISTFILLALILAYHALEIQVSKQICMYFRSPTKLLDLHLVDIVNKKYIYKISEI